MTNAELREWQQRMGMSLTNACEALGIGRSSYLRLLNGRASIDRRTELACAAIEAGVEGLKRSGPPVERG